MEQPVATPATPPRPTDLSDQLLTPPLTGGFRKFEGPPKYIRFSDYDAQHGLAKPLATAQASAERPPTAMARSAISYHGSSTYESTIMVVADGHMDRSSSINSMIGTRSLGTQFECAVPSHRIPGPSNGQPFRFMDLPLSIRKQMLSLIVTIPALICPRQNLTRGYNEPGAFIFAERRELLPGIAFVLTQSNVCGMKSRFASYPYTNISILRVSKQVHVEAKLILFGGNEFDIANLNKETSPPANFKVRLFPAGYQCHIRRLVIRAQAMYGFRYVLTGGSHADLKKQFRGLETLTLILELESANKGHGRRLIREKQERWQKYVRRVHHILQFDIFECEGVSKSIPIWIDLRVLFSGDAYVGGPEDRRQPEAHTEAVYVAYQKMQLKSAVVEAFELFKKSGR